MKRLIDIFLIGLILICFCTTGDAPLSGTSEQGNARIVATIYNPDMSPSAGTSVKLRKADYVKETESSITDDDNCIDVITGPDGSFVIDSVGTGVYFIEVNDHISNALLLKCSITSSDTLVVLGTDTLAPYSTVKGKIPEVSSARHYFVQIEGLDRLNEVNADGSFSISDLPQGSFTFKIIEQGSSQSTISIPDIVTESGKITILPGNGWLFSKQIHLNTTSSGADIQENVYNFPVLIRLNSSNFVFGEALEDGSDVRFIKAGPDSIQLRSEIERWDPVMNMAEIWVLFDTVTGNSDQNMCIMQWGNPDVKKESVITPVFDTSNGFGGVWHLSVTSDPSTQDATPNNFNGRQYNVGSTEGMIGIAGSFNNVNKSYISIENSSEGALNFPVNGTYTISAWVNSDSVTSNRVILSKGDLQYYLRIHSSNWHFAEYHETPSRGWEFTSSSYTFGNWVYLCCVRNGTSQYLYVNGTCVDSSITVMGDDDGTRNESFNVEIGRRTLPDGDDGLYFSGMIDEVRICTTARNADWIKLSYNNQYKDNLLVKIGN